MERTDIVRRGDPGQVTVLDWDEVFKNQHNVDSFVGWKLRKQREFEKLAKELKPLFDQFWHTTIPERKVIAHPNPDVFKNLDNWFNKKGK